MAVPFLKGKVADLGLIFSGSSRVLRAYMVSDARVRICASGAGLKCPVSISREMGPVMLERWTSMSRNMDSSGLSTAMASSTGIFCMG